MEHEGDGDASCNLRSRHSDQWFGILTKRLGNKRTGGDNQDHGIVEIGKNTKMIPGDLRRFAVTQTTIENYQLTLVRRNSQMTKIIIKLKYDVKVLVV